MNNAYAGGGFDPQQQVMVDGFTTDEPDNDLAEQVVTYAGDNIGYGTLLGIIAIGAALIFKKRIKKWLMD